jgi:hypothetical protein
MSSPFRRDHTNIDHDAVRRRRALDYALAELARAANALQAARSGEDNSMRDAVLTDAHRRLCSMQAEVRCLE